MSEIRLFYGSSTGNTRMVAEMIASAMGGSRVDVVNIAEAQPEDFQSGEVFILGVSTWENGALQKDWAAFFPRMDEIDFRGKKVALFGLGDASGFASRFVNALRILYDKVLERGAEIIGFWPVEGYEFADSTAVVEGRFVGLVIDQENASEQTVVRVGAWVAQLKAELKPPGSMSGENSAFPFVMACSGR